MDTIFRGVRFLRRYAFTNPLYTLCFLTVFWRRDYSFNTVFLSEEALRQSIKQGKSLIRLGDGEINLMLGLRNHYQKFSPTLKNAMFNIVQGYREDSPYILGVPRFINFSNDELKKIGKLQVWLPLKVMFRLHFQKAMSYVDAHSFYYDEYFERTVGEAIVGKRIMLVTRVDTIEKQKKNNNIPWSFIGIPVPEEESLAHYEEIKLNILKTISNMEKSDVVLLFAMGPVGKKLAHEFAITGIQSIDIGKVAEVMYTGESIAYIV